MASGLWFLAMMACSPVRRIPAPEPAPSVLPSSVARAHYLRGQVLAASGALEQAEYSLSRARIFDSNEPRILMALGSVAMTKGDMKGARDRYTQAAALSDTDPDPWFAHGLMEMAFGDKEVGRYALRRA